MSVIAFIVNEGESRILYSVTFVVLSLKYVSNSIVVTGAYG